MSTQAAPRQSSGRTKVEVAPASVDALALEVERIMCDLQAQFQRLTTLAAERLEAMRNADTRRLARCIADENEAVQAVAEIEKRRITAVGRLAERFGSADKSHTRVSWLAERVGGPVGDRLAARASELKSRIESLTKANEVARLTASTLSSHMEGLWRQAVQVLNHAQTYGRMGVMGAGPAVTSAVDVRS